MRYGIKVVGVWALALLLGCSAHRTRVDCGKHLTPINTPAPLASSEEPRR